MPLTAKGEKILRNMKAEYGEKEGKRNFYASVNAGRITGVDTGRREAEAQRRALDTGRYVPGRDRSLLGRR